MTSRDTLAKLAKQREQISDLQDDIERLSEWIDDARFTGGSPEVRYTTTGDYRWDDPQYETDGAAAFDLRACTTDVIRPDKHDVHFIGTGLKVGIPAGYAGIIAIRSSVSAWMHLSNSIGIIDSDYRGEVKMPVECKQPRDIEPGMRLAQMLIMPCPQANLIKTESLDSTERGDGGFGSTGE